MCKKGPVWYVQKGADMVYAKGGWYDMCKKALVWYVQKGAGMV